MRGKIITWTLVALFIVSLAISSIPISYAGLDEGYPIVSVSPYESGPKNLYQKFSVNIEVDFVGGDISPGLNAFQFKLSWNQKILKLDTANPAVEGPFLQTGGETYFAYAPGIAGESITIANMITTQDWAEGGGVLATVNLEVIGGGETNLTLTGTLLDVDSYEIYTEWVGGHFYSPFPYIDFKWFVPTAVEQLPQDFVNVTGRTFIRQVKPDGDVYYIYGPEYWKWAPVLQLTEDTGTPEQVDIVEGGTMFYGDEIIFDASESYDLNSAGQRVPLDPTAFNWTIRAGGVDTFTFRDKTYDTRYESGKELPYGDTFSYTFPGDLPDVYYPDWVFSLYHRLLGFHDLELKVKDSDNNEARYYTWIRIYRLAPTRLSMVHIPNPKHSLSKDGYTMTFEGKVQNRAGCGEFPYDFVVAYLELSRMIHANIWIRMQFTIEDSAGNPVPNGTVYSDALWLQMTEIPVTPFRVTWTMPSNIQRGTYYVKTTAWFCGSGVTYGLKATGTQLDTFKIVS